VRLPTPVGFAIYPWIATGIQGQTDSVEGVSMGNACLPSPPVAGSVASLVTTLTLRVVSSVNHHVRTSTATPYTHPPMCYDRIDMPDVELWLQMVTIAGEGGWSSPEAMRGLEGVPPDGNLTDAR
jgi:hypothetical protein